MRPLEEGMQALVAHIDAEELVREQQRQASRPGRHRVQHPWPTAEQTLSVQPSVHQQHQSSHAVVAYMFESAEAAVGAVVPVLPPVGFVGVTPLFRTLNTS